MAGYEVVLFDLDNTLSDFDSAQREAFTSLLVEFGVDHDEIESAGHLATFKAGAAPLWDQLERGELTLETLNDERFRRLVDTARLDLDPALLAPRYLKWLGTSGALFDDTIDLLDTLHGEVRMGLITNGYSQVQRPRLAHFDLEPYFEAIVISGEIGHAKPSVDFFAVAFEQLGHPDPASVLVVGDSLSSDIAGGVAAGAATCWFNPGGHPHSGDPRVDHVATILTDIASIVTSP